MVISKIQKRDGTIVKFNKKKIAIAIFKAAQSVGGKDKKGAIKLADKVEKQLSKQKIKNPTVEQVQDAVEKTLIKNKHSKTAKAFILYRQRRAKEREEKKAVIGKLSSKKLNINALTVLKERYLLKDSEGKIIENPNDMFMRVAKNIAHADLNYNKDADIKTTEKQFYKIMENLDFLPNSPTLMNAGTKIQQLAACFVLPIEDSMEGIFQSLKDAAIIHKSGGGTGFSFSRLRPKNSVVKSTKGVASGPISFLTVYNAATEVIKQGGKRRGANMGILRIDHPDIMDFINCKENNEEITNFNLSVGITEKFMEAVENGEEYDLIDPTSKEIVRKMDAKTVFNLLVSAAWRNGDPGIVFVDRMNKDNPTPGIAEIESTNPCGEQPLLPYEACNLGSINLGHFVKNKKIQWDSLGKLISIAIHFLDNVIDMSEYPLQKITDMVNSNRKIGLGVMGWADMLNQMEIPYNSMEGVQLAEKVMGFVKKEADNASCKLARMRGVFKNWEQSIYNRESPCFQGEHMEIRNATRTTIAPTGTIGMIADCSGGVEPLFALSYVKRVMDGKELFYVDNYFKKELEKRNMYSEKLMQKIINKGSIHDIEELPSILKETFVVAHDISPEYHLKMQASFQKYTDNAVSKTVNFPNNATIEDVHEVYMQAYKFGCKGVTIYRDGSKEGQVLNLNIDIEKEKKQQKNKEQTKEEIVKEIEGIIEKKKEQTNEAQQDLCPDCGSKLIFQEGCAKCPLCGFSFCS